jgi:acyl carrier protein
VQGEKMSKSITQETRNSLLNIIKSLLLSDLPIEKIESMALVELGVDSMVLLQISFEFENMYSLKIDIDNISSDVTIGSMIDNLISNSE